LVWRIRDAARTRQKNRDAACAIDLVHEIVVIGKADKRLDRMAHRRMIAPAELATDRGKRPIGKFAAKRHADLARSGDDPMPVSAGHVRHAALENGAHR